VDSRGFAQAKLYEFSHSRQYIVNCGKYVFLKKSFYWNTKPIHIISKQSQSLLYFLSAFLQNGYKKIPLLYKGEANIKQGLFNSVHICTLSSLLRQKINFLSL
jgi:hypothetical protein